MGILGFFHRRRTAAAACVAAVSALLIAGCSTKGDDSGDTTAAGDVKTGAGISGTTIKLGVISDLTGVFAATGKDVVAGQQVFWDVRNAAGGVCSRYTVQLDIKDHAYNVQNATSLYSGMKNEVLAFQQILGSPMITALSPRIEQDRVLTVPVSYAAGLADNPYLALFGPTYDIEVVNGLDYLMGQKKITDGGALGIVYLEGELGGTALLGAKFYAGKHGMQVVEQKVKASDQDMSAQVTALKAAGVKAIVLATTPTQTASVATVAATQGLSVPLLGMSPSYVGSLLKTPARQALLDNFYNTSPYAAYDRELTKAALAEYQKKFPDSSPAANMIAGYGSAMVLSKILDKACENGDLTSEGLRAAKQSLTRIDTGGLVGPIDYSRPGVTPVRQHFMLRPADGAVGGLTTVADLFEGPTAATFTDAG